MPYLLRVKAKDLPSVTKRPDKRTLNPHLGTLTLRSPFQSQRPLCCSSKNTFFIRDYLFPLPGMLFKLI